MQANFEQIYNQINIFSAAAYTDQSEAFWNSLAYLGYVSSIIFHSTFGRLILAVMSVDDLIHAKYNSFFWNVSLILGGLELLSFFMGLVGLYRLGISICTLFPSLKPVIDQMMSVIEKVVSFVSVGVKADEQKDISEESNKKVQQNSKSFFDTCFDYLENDWTHKKEQVSRAVESCSSFLTAIKF